MRLQENWLATLRGHAEIPKAIRARKPKAARDSMRAYLSQALEVMTGDANAGAKPTDAFEAADAAR